MSATTQTVARARPGPASPPGPSFAGAVRGELGKLGRQRAAMAMLLGGASSTPCSPP